MSNPTPHERFIMGQGESGRFYIIHTQRPRFVAELFEDDAFPVGDLSMSFDESGEVLSNFAWIDQPPAPMQMLEQLRRDIEAFINESDFRADQDVKSHERAEDVDED